MPNAPAKPSALRLLILAPSSDHPTSVPPFSNLLRAITGSKPSDEVTSFCGYTSHPPLSLRTKYYNADVSIWCDELPLPAIGVSSAGHDKSTTPTTKESAEAEAEADNDNDNDNASCSTLEEWQSQMLSPTASEVRAVIGGIILILPISSSSSSQSAEVLSQSSHMSLVEAVHSLREAAEDESYGRDIASIVVLQSTSSASGVTHAKLFQITEQLEESCLSDKGILGWDFVAWDGGEPSTAAESAIDERNEYGEKTGIQRVIEVLEGVDWSAAPSWGGDDDEAFDLDHELEVDVDVDDDAADDGGLGFSPTNILRNNARLSGLDHELQREMMELKMSLGDDAQGEGEGEGAEAETSDQQVSTDVREEDEDAQVEQLQGLMERVVAIREAGSEMPRTEREKFAKREIGRIIREMG
ncbi:hypothetical protein H2202_006929 [Exophiala xenobiotica]|nr:hypothetical protein H2202_006929 [Exophiala xenobiotica]KAK5206466.1 hypothetical protein LTR41_007904 [Exophiala xenobiotica]KAK5217462.1 hypothetical protein LTR72_009579 [Exophiala xenobiotica]KAK5232810.1 hypothetical protein LTR47_006037 [Exophiala xenobiotica]KAK5255452.1 hypothetical protein LTS06_000473 [Exophiala xenobiotica]